MVTTAALSLVIKCHYLFPAILGPILPLHLGIQSSGTIPHHAFWPTERTGPELCNGAAHHPLPQPPCIPHSHGESCVLLTLPGWASDLRSLTHSNLPNTLSLQKSPCTVSQGRSGTSGSFSVDHLLVHVSANRQPNRYSPNSSCLVHNPTASAYGPVLTCSA